MDREKCCVKLSVHPSRGLVDEKFIVLVQKVPPGFQLTVHSLHQCEDGHYWQAFAHHTANATGTVNVAEDPSLGGTYSGVEPVGLLWSLSPVPGSQPGLRLRKKNVQTPIEVTISVYQGHQTEGFVGQIPLASVVVERWYMAPGVRRISISEGGLSVRATLFLPPGPGRFPGILDLWGGGVNLMEYRAALLASHGFASMALDYLTCNHLQKTGNMAGMEYFEPRCAVCISGSHVQPVEGSVADIFAYCKKNASNIRFSEEKQIISRDLLPIPTDPMLKVDVGQLQCPLLLVVGEDDQTWPTYESAMDIKQMMERAGNGHLLTILSYPNTGHLIEPPYTPHTRTSVFGSVLTGEKTMVLWGGEMVSHSRAQEDSWRKIVAFLMENLHGGRNPAAYLSSHL
ncbi:Acyl-coenzyme A thioesterase 4 [Channa argus]|uniref:Acyl-coenzyme A thioesterase 4 n=1 Tax=Channa argus TaxID=215402 RepID=A0A6G1QUD5_CHAAH|nr:Acyl-coenzyme A thioesterase 4 [Channa argus]